MSDPTPIPMILWCPECGERHVDEGEFATRPHHTHACQVCGMVWRPAKEPTCGVDFLPGFGSPEKVGLAANLPDPLADAASRFLLELFADIKHGTEAHREWLLGAIRMHVGRLRQLLEDVHQTGRVSEEREGL